MLGCDNAAASPIIGDCATYELVDVKTDACPRWTVRVAAGAYEPVAVVSDRTIRSTPMSSGRRSLLPHTSWTPGDVRGPSLLERLPWAQFSHRRSEAICPSPCSSRETTISQIRRNGRCIKNISGGRDSDHRKVSTACGARLVCRENGLCVVTRATDASFLTTNRSEISSVGTAWRFVRL